MGRDSYERRDTHDVATDVEKEVLEIKEMVQKILNRMEQDRTYYYD